MFAVAMVTALAGVAAVAVTLLVLRPADGRRIAFLPAALLYLATAVAALSRPSHSDI